MASIAPSIRIELHPDPIITAIIEDLIFEPVLHDAMLCAVPDNDFIFNLTPMDRQFQVETNHLIDENGNVLADESGDYLTW